MELSQDILYSTNRVKISFWSNASNNLADQVIQILTPAVTKARLMVGKTLIPPKRQKRG